MKKIINILFLSLLVFAAGCSDSDDPETGLSVVSSNVTFSALGGTGSIVVSAPSTVSAVSSQEWCSVSVSGSTVTVQVPSNGDSKASRTANVTITSAGESVTVNVYQYGYYFTVGGSHLYFLYKEGESGTIPVSASGDIEIAEIVYHTGSDWLEAVIDGGVITVTTIAENPDAENDRTATILLESNGVQKEIEIYQSNKIIYETYLGEWTLVAAAGEDAGTYTVSLSEKDYGSTYTVSGLAYDFTMRYDDNTATLWISNLEDVGIYVEDDIEYIMRLIMVYTSGTSLNSSRTIISNVGLNGTRIVVELVGDGTWTHNGIGFYYTLDTTLGTRYARYCNMTMYRN